MVRPTPTGHAHHDAELQLVFLKTSQKNVGLVIEYSIIIGFFNPTLLGTFFMKISLKALVILILVSTGSMQSMQLAKEVVSKISSNKALAAGVVFNVVQLKALYHSEQEMKAAERILPLQEKLNMVQSLHHEVKNNLKKAGIFKQITSKELDEPFVANYKEICSSIDAEINEQKHHMPWCWYIRAYVYFTGRNYLLDLEKNHNKRKKGLMPDQD